MQSLHKLTRLIFFTILIYILSTTINFADENKDSSMPFADMSAMMSPMTNMMNPAMYMNMMNPAMYMNPMMGMNPMTSMNMMYPMMGMMGPMMGMGMPMMGSMMNPMAMMNPMMGGMAMGNPMMGGMGMPYSSGSSTNPMNQMMDPKQYEQWFNQWSEMMNSFMQQTETSTK